MNQLLGTLVDRIRERFPLLDVRTDQCDIVRIIARGVFVGIEAKGDEFVAKFISLESPYDFEAPVLKTLTSTDLGEFEQELLPALAELVPHRPGP
jgi:hypothetical protein